MNMKSINNKTHATYMNVTLKSLDENVYLFD